MSDRHDEPRCFHCQEPLAGSKLTARIGARLEPVCCPGCQAVAEMIAGSGLADYYVRRTTPAPRPTAASEEGSWRAYLEPQVASAFVTRGAVVDSVDLLIENLRCPACGWLIERAVGAIPDVKTVEVNAGLGRARIEWTAGAPRFEQVMRTIAQLGYVPHPITEETTSRVYCAERRSMLKRFVVATFGMMQVMMFAVAGYSAELGGERIDATLEQYFRLVSLLVSVPVLFYAGQPFLTSAWNSLRTKSVGMDLTVSAALVLAFVASAWNTFVGHGEVYFDSITMFVFFLTLVRLIELIVRHRTSSVADALARHLPATAQRAVGDKVETVPVQQLRLGDNVIVPSGAIVPADGEIVDGATLLDESLLTGESLPVARRVGDRVASGSINTGSPLRIAVTATGSGTVLANIVNLLRRAQTRKPAAMRTANRAAAVFLRVVLIASVMVCLAWLAVDPKQAFAATLAVLVVACPCAFSIAMPAALAASTARLAKQGVLITRPEAIETLADIDHVIFDKTGTLTRGEIQLAGCEVVGTRSREECLAIAAALERSSGHPIASAFRNMDTAGLMATAIETVPGFGIEGTIDGKRYRIGIAAFAAELRGAAVPRTRESLDGTTIVLGDEREALAVFTLSDALREDSPAAIEKLRSIGIDSEILSGDGSAAVASVAKHCGITSFFARRTPEQKLSRVHELHAQGKRVAMVGDGINDAPVLGAADVSIAMGRGAALALAAADVIFVSERPSALAGVIRTARRTAKIARQNLLWAGLYNFSALPLAALGYIPPWAAALGMSASSLFVLLNALRLLPRQSARNAQVARTAPAALATSA
ncbi:MAG TPA: heavy metal translocating P-type ATPase [Steroidobacteraceae bacterium]